MKNVEDDVNELRYVPLELRPGSSERGPVCRNVLMFLCLIDILLSSH